MKTLVDGTKVSSRTYYYLLDYNDRDSWTYICETLHKNKLCDLNIDEYRDLWNHATNFDSNVLELTTI